MKGRIFKIGLVSIVTIWILILGAIIWHCNSIISSMVNGRIEDKDGKKLLKKYDKEIDKVETKTSDGIKLSAWRFKTNGPKGIVIVLHGMHGMDGGSLLDFGKFFKEAGYDAILLDMRAHGYSSGNEIGLGYTEVRDVNALLDWIKEKKEYKNKKIIVYGLSMGGSTAINAAAVRKDIDAVISVSAYESFESQIIDYMKKANVPKAMMSIYKPCFRLVLLLKYGMNPVKNSSINTIKKISPRPILLIHGDKDSQTSVQQAYHLKEKAGDNSELWVVKDKEHLVVEDILGEENAWYRDKILEFIKKN
ncbi:alpha/beta fold hydrolase [Clostridium bovifaecis]|uniref:Alpha/beta fold hydrolase n=1 Tax=Clostridium bovifaecis TaxID=2184719 RepID=A0A6I6ETA1_9CLOT|nr:alpha/beta fold hydrolase [Clostridium bovifaecis]